MFHPNVGPAFWNERHDVSAILFLFRHDTCIYFGLRYYIVYVFQGAGLTGRRSNLIADVSESSCVLAKPKWILLALQAVQYVLNVAFTGMLLLIFSSRIPIEFTGDSPCHYLHWQVGSQTHDSRWYIAYGFLALSCWRTAGPFRKLGFNRWQPYVPRDSLHAVPSPAFTAIWVVENNGPATKAIIVCSYFFVCRYVD